ncbi:hypothetical protein TI05_16195, partial [Achromatium sp. WMS3]
MHQIQPPITLPIDIDQLEDQVEELVTAYTNLQAENVSLRQNQKMLIEEKAALIKKTELARNR